jgi:hypothetical protein
MWWAYKPLAFWAWEPVRRTGGRSSHELLDKTLIGPAPFALIVKLGLKELLLDYEAGVSPIRPKLRGELVPRIRACQGQS